MSFRPWTKAETIHVEQLETRLKAYDQLMAGLKAKYYVDSGNPSYAGTWRDSNQCALFHQLYHERMEVWKALLTMRYGKTGERKRYMRKLLYAS